MKRYELKYGIFMLLGFISFFFLMMGLGLYTNLNLRVLNILIHFAFAYLAMRTFRTQTVDDFDYLSTFAVGFRTSVIAVLGFATFQFLYLQFIDPGFMLYIKENAIMGNYLTPGVASLFLVIEGFGVTIFSSYVGMRYLSALEEVPPVS
jgi:Protein of unknown function (DUF4199)